MSNPHPSFSTKQRWIIAINVAVSVVAVLALAIMANYLATRNFTRFQLRSDNPNELSAQTLNLLRGLTNEVTAIVFYERDSIEFHSAVSALLDEYKFACPNLKVKYVDYVRNPSEALLIKEKYKLDFPGDDYLKNMVIFDCNGRPKTIYEKDLYDLDYQGVLSGKTKEVKRTGFKGEMKFTEAINNVIDSKQLRAFFLQGHREHRLDDDDPNLGYSKLAAVIRQQNILLEPIMLTVTNLPAECNLLIIAGPVQPLDASELEKINQYLARGGRLFVLLNYQNFTEKSPTGLEKVLANWGVLVGNNMVLEWNGGKEDAKAKDLILNNYLSPSHPIIKYLLRSQLKVIMPCTVEKRPGGHQDADAPRVDELVATDTNTIVCKTSEGGHPAPDYFRDRRGSVSVAASVEKGSVQGLGADRGSTRIVVVGDSVFLVNGLLDVLGNRDFAVQSVNWLVDNPRLMGGIVPRPMREYRVIMSQRQLTSVAWILMAGFPGAVLCLGFLVWFRRRS